MESLGISLVTIALAPTIAFSPIITFERMVAFAPMGQPFFNMVG